MKSILEHLADDPNIDPRLRAIFSAGIRKPIQVPGSDRQREVRDEEHADQLRAERVERIARGD